MNHWKILSKFLKLLILGEIELRNDKETDGFNSKYFGDIHFQQNGDPVLIIGHHTMTGKVVKVLLDETHNQNQKQFKFQIKTMYDKINKIDII